MKTASKSAIYAFIIAICIPVLSHAGDIPRYDVDKHCTKVAQTSGNSNMIYNGCIEMEQTAYDSIRQLWASIPEKTQSHCNKVASSSGGSYSILQGCINMEIDAANNKKKFTY